MMIKNIYNSIVKKVGEYKVFMIVLQRNAKK